MSIHAALIFAALFGLAFMLVTSVGVAMERDDNATSLRLLGTNVVAIVIAYGTHLNPLVMFCLFAAMSIIITDAHGHDRHDVSKGQSA